MDNLPDAAFQTMIIRMLKDIRVQGKLVGWLDVPEWIVMTSKGGSLRLGAASLSFSDFLWKGSPPPHPVWGFSQQQNSSSDSTQAPRNACCIVELTTTLSRIL